MNPAGEPFNGAVELSTQTTAFRLISLEKVVFGPTSKDVSIRVTQTLLPPTLTQYLTMMHFCVSSASEVFTYHSVFFYSNIRHVYLSVKMHPKMFAELFIVDHAPYLIWVIAHRLKGSSN